MLIPLFSHSVFSGPAAFCQRSQRSVPFALSAQHAEQSGARTAALEEAGPGTEKVRVRPPCCSQLNCSNGLKQQQQQQKSTVTEPSVYTAYFFLFEYILLIQFNTSEVNKLRKTGCVELESKLGDLIL